MRRLLLVALAVVVGACGRTVTAPEATFENIAKFCVAVDSIPLATRYECRVRFAPTP